MSNVFILNSKSGVRRSGAFAAGHSADVVIFHGVRIERLTDDMIQTSVIRNRRLPSLQNQATAEELE